MSYSLMQSRAAGGLYFLLRGGSHCSGASIEGSAEDFYGLAAALLKREDWAGAERCAVRFTEPEIPGTAYIYSPRNTWGGTGEVVPLHLVEQLAHAILRGLPAPHSRVVLSMPRAEVVQAAEELGLFSLLEREPRPTKREIVEAIRVIEALTPPAPEQGKVAKRANRQRLGRVKRRHRQF